MEEVKNYMGRCRYCGREQAVIAHDAAEADFMVTRECSCHEGNLEDQLNQMHFHNTKLVMKNSGKKTTIVRRKLIAQGGEIQG